MTSRTSPASRDARWVPWPSLRLFVRVRRLGRLVPGSPIRLRSLRLSLTLWYLSFLVLILSGFSAVLYTSVAASLTHEFDDVLMGHASGVVDAMTLFWKTHRATESAPGNWTGSPPSSLPQAMTTGVLSGMVASWMQKTGGLQSGQPVRVLARDGQVLGQSPGFADISLPANARRFARARHGEVLYETLALPHGRFRVLTRPVASGNDVLYIVQVASSMAKMESSLQRLRMLLLIMVPLTVLVTSFVGWFLASMALRPVNRMVRQATQISADRLYERVKVPTSGDELEALAVTLNDMLARLERAFKRIRQFSAAASHELRTPLTVMKGELEVALRRPRASEEYRQVLRTHLATINEMSQVVGELLALARSEVGGRVLATRSVSARELVTRVAERFEPMARAKRIAIHTAQDREVTLTVEPQLMERVIANLLDNAVKFTPEHGDVWIDWGRQRRESFLRVRDNGPGISPDELPHIFDRFFSRDPVTVGEGSTGVGLGLSRWIVEAHHGRLEVETLERGTVFTVRLPE